MALSWAFLIVAVMLLSGCQLYWTKPGTNLAGFTADHQTCMTKGATEVGNGQVLVNLDVYRACLKVNGWKRETGGKAGNPPGFYRGLEDAGPVPVGFVPRQIGDTEGHRVTGDQSNREMFCRRAHIEGRSDWRNHMDDFRRCMTQ